MSTRPFLILGLILLFSSLYLFSSLGLYQDKSHLPNPTSRPNPDGKVEKKKLEDASGSLLSNDASDCRVGNLMKTSYTSSRTCILAADGNIFLLRRFRSGILPRSSLVKSALSSHNQHLPIPLDHPAQINLTLSPSQTLHLLDLSSVAHPPTTETRQATSTSTLRLLSSTLPSQNNKPSSRNKSINSELILIYNFPLPHSFNTKSLNIHRLSIHSLLPVTKPSHFPLLSTHRTRSDLLCLLIPACQTTSSSTCSLREILKDRKVEKR